MVANSQAEQQLSVDESDRFDELTGQKIGHKKTVGFTVPFTEPLLRSRDVPRGVLLKQVNVDKLLWVLFPVDNTPDPTLQDKRVLGAQAFLPGIVKLPAPLEEKAALIALKTAGEFKSPLRKLPVILIKVYFRLFLVNELYAVHQHGPSLERTQVVP